MIDAPGATMSGLQTQEPVGPAAGIIDHAAAHDRDFFVVVGAAHGDDLAADPRGW